MREGGVPEDNEEDSDPSRGPLSPYLKPEVPERRSVIPPSRETFVFPSGLAARPVEEYLVPSVPEEAVGTTTPDEGEPGSEQSPEAWPYGGGGGADSGDGGSRRLLGLPLWAIWAGLGALAVVAAIVVFGGASPPGPVPSVSFTAPIAPGDPGFFDDGIAEDEYPEAAEPRGEGFPGAVIMADWVWDRVSSQWAIVLIAGNSYQDSGAQPLPTPVVYLVSPEGVYFELAELPSTSADGATLVSWHEEERTARIVWNGGTRGGLLHLETGEVEDTSFQMTSGRTKEVQFLATDASGREVWLAWASDFTETRYFSWTSGGGWERILSGQDDLYLEWLVNPVSGDGTRIALQIFTLADSLVASERSLPPGTPNFVVYSLEDNKSTRYRPAFGPEPNCWFTGWIDLESVGFSCWNDDEGTQTDYRAAIDGSTVQPYQVEVPWFSDLLGQVAVRHPDAPIELVVDPEYGTVTGVRVLQDSGAVTVVDSVQIGETGGTVRSVDEVAPGVYRLVMWGSIVIGIDTQTATIGPMVVAQPSTSPMVRSYVFFGEATPSGVGLNWGD